MKIAILGGSFDPIHQGHIQIAKEALKQTSCQNVWFMPAKQAPLKDQQQATFQQRCAMISLAIAPYRHMSLCTLEGERDEYSYTIDTLRLLKKRYPMHTFIWLIGDDQAKQFSDWKDVDALFQEAAFYVFTRDAQYHPASSFHTIKMPVIDVSSSMIRTGQGLRFVPESIRLYMGTHGLYFETIMQHNMNEQRYFHSLSVAKLCAKLALAHNLDAHKAYIAGLIHDACKQMPYEKQAIWMNYHMPSQMNEPPAIWHGYIGAYYAKHVLYIRDKDIINSIFYHVIGRNHNAYERIVYIADKLDPSRGYDSNNEIALCMHNLTIGYEVVKAQQITYLKKEGVKT